MPGRWLRASLFVPYFLNLRRCAPIALRSRFGAGFCKLDRGGNLGGSLLIQLEQLFSGSDVVINRYLWKIPIGSLFSCQHLLPQPGGSAQDRPWNDPEAISGYFQEVWPLPARINSRAASAARRTARMSCPLPGRWNAISLAFWRISDTPKHAPQLCHTVLLFSHTIIRSFQTFERLTPSWKYPMLWPHRQTCRLSLHHSPVLIPRASPDASGRWLPTIAWPPQKFLLTSAMCIEPLSLACSRLLCPAVRHHLIGAEAAVDGDAMVAIGGDHRSCGLRAEINPVLTPSWPIYKCKKPPIYLAVS